MLINPTAIFEAYQQMEISRGSRSLSFIEKRNDYRPATGSAPFEVNEIFFSRTDKRGIILASNYIFKRVTGFEWEEILGAPHNLIRHPDMPKGVFWLFWETLNSGQPIGVYVKNRANDGLYYWTFAVAMPFQDGFLSVRIKPTGELLGIVEKEYEALRKAETEDGFSPEESAAKFLRWVQALGYEDYQTFASDALTQELFARDVAMGNKRATESGSFTKMLSVADGLQTETAALSCGFEAISTVPTNMRIIAARLEPSGGAVSSLAQNYWEMSEEMSRWFQDFVDGSDSNFATIRSALVASQFMFGISRILNEVVTIFSSERRSLGNTDIGNEKNQMNEMAKHFSEKAESGLRRVVHESEQILRAISMMRRFALGLSSTRVMCNIESARLPSGGGSLIDVINQLEVFQKNLNVQMDQIEAQSHEIKEYTQTLLSGGAG